MKRESEEFHRLDPEAAERSQFERRRRADRQAAIARKAAFLEL